MNEIICEILKKIKEMSELTEKILKSSEEQNAGVSQISLALNYFDESTGVIVQKAEMISGCACEMENMAARLEELCRNFQTTELEN